MSAAEATRWSLILYGIAAFTLMILVIVFVRAGISDAQRRRDEQER
jgi:hypothetical protein